MRFRNPDSPPARYDKLEMTPMIDVVFQLLIFFLFSLKILSPEGDFNLKMPVADPGTCQMNAPQLPPVRVRLAAGSGGRLTGIRLGGRTLKDFRELNWQLRGIVGDERGPGSVAEATEVELDCDYDLRYEYVIDAVGAVSGYVADDGRSIVRLVEKIRLSSK